jgi:predicted ATP-grasp superfamily ATP-dependent carboligase
MNPDTPSRTPAVVVGAAGACGLGVVRSLSRAKIPVFLVDTTPYAPAMHTRFAQKVLVRELSGPPLVGGLHALAAKLSGPAVLFLTSDEAMLTVSEHRAELASSYRFTLPSHECLISLAQKTTFQELAELLQFPLPRSIRVSSAADFPKLAGLQFPVIIKPSTKTAAYVNASFPRAYKVTSPSEAQAKCELVLTAVPEVVVQEWIEGPDTELYFCLLYRSAAGSTLCSFVGRKLSVWPPDVGLTASCVAAPEAREELVFLTESFFRQVSFYGMGGIEFKRDVHGGRFVMIEPTVGRLDAQEEVATINGVNIPLIAYFHEAGLPLPSTSCDYGTRVWRNSWAHWRAVHGNSGRPIERRGLKVLDAYWRLNDPLPALMHSFAWSIKALGRTLSHHRKGDAAMGAASDRVPGGRLPIARDKSSFPTG